MPRNDFPAFTNAPLEWERLKAELPTIIGNMAINFYQDRFDEEGWINSSFEPWAALANGRTKKRGRIQPLNDKGKRKTRRGILVQSGALRRGIMFHVDGPLQITITDPIKYASVHNEGFDGTVNVPAHSRGKYSKSKSGSGIFSVKTKKERQLTTKTKTGQTEVKAYSYHQHIPKREFIGESEFFNRRVQLHLEKALKSIFKK